MTVECDGAGNAAEFAAWLASNGGAAASDVCGGVTWSNDSTGLSDLCGATGAETVTFTATDDCLNTSTTSATFTIEDTTTPVISGCPSNINVNADAGGCDAVVAWTDPTAMDNCDPAPVVTCVPASGSAFPTGTTTVTCTAIDDCSNSDAGSQCTFDVTVNAVNDVIADVVLAGVAPGSLGVPDPLTRCIKFVAKNGSTCATEEHEVVMTFSGNPATATAAFTVACGAYTEICAKDEQHTLYDTTTLTDAGTTYTAVPLSLEGGDTDNDNDVDIHDVGWLLLQFGGLPGDGDCPWDGTRDADFSNNGAVGSEDYSFQTANWLTLTTCGCTPLLTSTMKSFMFTSELEPQDAEKADLNGDGIVDHEDVKIFETQRGLGHTLSTRMQQSMVYGDFDGDLKVDLGDFAAFAEMYGRNTVGPDAAHKRFDADGNGTIDLADFASFAANFTG